MSSPQDGLYLLSKEQYQNLLSGDPNIRVTQENFIPYGNRNLNLSAKQIPMDPVASNPIQQPKVDNQNFQTPASNPPLQTTNTPMAVPSSNMAPGYSQNGTGNPQLISYPPNFPPGYNQNNPPGYNPNYPPGYNPNYPPGFNPNYPPGYNPNAPSQQYKQNHPIKNIQDNVREFSKTLPCLLGFYLFLIIGCIVVQYVVCGSKQAANLYISTTVFIIVSIVLINIAIRDINNRIYLVYATMFFTFLSFVLGTAAFGLAVSHPPILIFKVKYSYPGYSYSSSYYDYEYTYTQEAGSCLIYSDEPGLELVIDNPSSYQNGLQYGVLGLYCVSFLLTLAAFYNFFSKSWRCASVYRENASIHPEQQQPYQYQYPVQV